MAGLGIRLFTDEDVSWTIAADLLALGYDVESCKAAKRGAQRIPDYSQLMYACQERRAILTFNRKDFEILHQEYQDNGWFHPGIIWCDQLSDKDELKRRVKLHLDSVAPSAQENKFLELSR
jgi:hypothetical protein